MSVKHSAAQLDLLGQGHEGDVWTSTGYRQRIYETFRGRLVARCSTTHRWSSQISSSEEPKSADTATEVREETGTIQGEWRGAPAEAGDGVVDVEVVGRGYGRGQAAVAGVQHAAGARAAAPQHAARPAPRALLHRRECARARALSAPRQTACCLLPPTRRRHRPARSLITDSPPAPAPSLPRALLPSSAHYVFTPQLFMYLITHVCFTFYK